MLSSFDKNHEFDFIPYDTIYARCRIRIHIDAHIARMSTNFIGNMHGICFDYVYQFMRCTIRTVHITYELRIWTGLAGL